MNDKIKEEFERNFPRPEGVWFSDLMNKYETHYNYLDCYPYQQNWIVWQTAFNHIKSEVKRLKVFHIVEDDIHHLQYKKFVLRKDVLKIFKDKP